MHNRLFFIQPLLFLKIDWNIVSAIGTCIAALGACIYTGLTYFLLKSNNETVRTNNRLAEFQIYTEIAKALNDAEVKIIIDKCCQGTFVLGNIEEETILKEKVLYTLEDLAKFWQDELISVGSVNSGFGSIILNVGNCPAVVEFIKRLRSKNHSKNLYSGIEELYSAIFKDSDPDEKIGFRRTMSI